jgi:hypothetical protein
MRAGSSLCGPLSQRRPARLVLARSGPKVTREFRENDDGTFADVTVPGAPTTRKDSSGALYVDDPSAPRPVGPGGQRAGRTSCGSALA